MTIHQLEAELKKRWAQPYQWGVRQNDELDRKTNFIYSISSYEEVLVRTTRLFGNSPDFEKLLNYTLNRWYNFWSARVIEEVFCRQPGVNRNSHQKDRLVDFDIHGLSFDHKTSVFPKGFKHPLDYALCHERELIEWLYKNQSQEGRKHHANRLFIMLHQPDGHHWKLKAELCWLRSLITQYIHHFDQNRLHRFNFDRSQPTLAGIVWAIGNN